MSPARPHGTRTTDPARTHHPAHEAASSPSRTPPPDGRLTPVVGRTVPLPEAARAHALIESRSLTGKVLLRAGR
ncbi:zinc-binding dehydrogenase [Streptomyces sp. NPDC052687]|uniref:zinc-binding dehydrogenase n=1 Tax=Streptomyces sp. NPDC052687 TaxID=3154759 RepID=UPI00341AA640